jgi:hypothetical protein
LLVRERLYLLAVKLESADDRSFLQQRDYDRCTSPAEIHKAASVRFAGPIDLISHRIDRAARAG